MRTMIGMSTIMLTRMSTIMLTTMSTRMIMSMRILRSRSIHTPLPRAVTRIITIMTTTITVTRMV